MNARRQADLEWSVFATLAWYGVRGRPLTLPELQRFLLKNTATVEQLKPILHDARIRHQEGYYFLEANKVRLPTPESLQNYRYKWWRLRLAVSILRHVPYLRMVGALQTMYDRTVVKPHDIDVLVIAKHGRLFTVRTLVTLSLLMAGLWRHGTRIANRIDLSWYATTAHLDMEPITRPPYDPLLVFLFAEMAPVFDEDDTYHEFVRANEWIRNYLPAYDGRPHTAARPSGLARAMERVLAGRTGTALERRLERWQLGRIAENPANPDPDVEIIATAKMLKFHEKERRRKDRETWEQTMQKLSFDPKLVQK